MFWKPAPTLLPGLLEPTASCTPCKAGLQHAPHQPRPASLGLTILLTYCIPGMGSPTRPPSALPSLSTHQRTAALPMRYLDREHAPAIYVDDAVIEAAPEHLQELETAGLQMASQKTQVWSFLWDMQAEK